MVTIPTPSCLNKVRYYFLVMKGKSEERPSRQGGGSLVIKDPGFCNDALPSLASCLTVQSGCLGSSYHAQVSSSRKEGRDLKQLLIPFEGGYIPLVLHPLPVTSHWTQLGHMATMGFRVGWEMKSELDDHIPGNHWVLITERKGMDIRGKTIVSDPSYLEFLGSRFFVPHGMCVCVHACMYQEEECQQEKQGLHYKNRCKNQ